jgi:hypothetical protein
MNRTRTMICIEPSLKREAQVYAASQYYSFSGWVASLIKRELERARQPQQQPVPALKAKQRQLEPA